MSEETIDTATGWATHHLNIIIDPTMDQKIKNYFLLFQCFPLQLGVSQSIDIYPSYGFGNLLGYKIAEVTHCITLFSR